MSDLLTTIIAILAAIAGIYSTYEKISNARNIDKALYEKVIEKLPRLKKIVLSAKIASASISFKKFVDEDLVDGNLDGLEAFELFCRGYKKAKVDVALYLKQINARV